MSEGVLNDTGNDSYLNSSQLSSSSAASDLLEKCNKTSYLDGTFFTVILENSDINKKIVCAKCTNCGKDYSGQYNVSSNFYNHLKVKKTICESKYQMYKILNL